MSSFRMSWTITVQKFFLSSTSSAYESSLPPSVFLKMPSGDSSNYGSLLPTSTAPHPPSLAATVSANSSVREHPRPPPDLLSKSLPSTVRFQIATFRPWKELVDPTYFSLPYSYAEAISRVRRNLHNFRLNYALVILFVLFFSLIYHPFSMIIFLIIFVAWLYFCFLREEPVNVLGRTVDDRTVIIVLGLVTIGALVLTHVGLNVLVGLIVGVVIVGVHGAFRGVEDLFLNENEAIERGLISVVGTEQRPIRSSK